MLFRVLGPVAVEAGDGKLALGGPRHRVLLATLLASPGRVVSVDRLVEALWERTPPRRAVELVHTRISELRRLLRSEGEPDAIITDRPGYLIDVGSHDIDAALFEYAAVAGRRALTAGDPVMAAEQLAGALTLWRGTAFADASNRPFVQPEIARLENLRRQALLDRIAADLAAGRHREVLAELEGLVRTDPLHERYRCLLMLALYRDGRQSEALATYRQTARLLRDELGIDPGPELQHLHRSLLRQEPELASASPPVVTPAPTLIRSQHPVPAAQLSVPLTSFIDREVELDRAGGHLDRSRLVTLTGAGGCGKSRLAIEVALARRDAFRGRVWVVELAAVLDPALVPSAVVSALEVREKPHQPLVEAAAEYLGPVRALLVLDNCEHLLDAVADLADRLMHACPNLRVLCTSRERIGIAGEVLCPVPGLPVPPPGDRPTAEVAATAAVRLFVDRASAVQPAFRLTDRNAVAVAEVARRLDGLPLPIELAAARTATFSAAQIAGRLDDRFRLLCRGNRTALPHHQTLRAVFDWSYELLDDTEQRFFEQISVFVGGFTAEAAEAVYAGTTPDDPTDLLGRLVDKSLVVADTAPGPDYRYRLLETLRAYALARLEDRGELPRQLDRHLQYYVGLAQAASVGLRGPQLRTWLDRLQLEHGNLRAALERSLSDGQRETAARLAGSVYPFWDLRGHYLEGRGWLRRVLATPHVLDNATRVRVLMGATTLAVIQSDLDEATEMCTAAVEISDANGDEAGLAHALQYLGFIALCSDDLGCARQLLNDSRRTAAAAGARWEQAWANLFLATANLAECRFTDAFEVAGRAEVIGTELGDPELLSWVAVVRGFAAGRCGRDYEAARFSVAGILGFHQLGGLWGLSLALLAFALSASNVGCRDEVATTLLGASETIRNAAGCGMIPFIAAWLAEATHRLRARLGNSRFDAAWSAGAALSRADAVALATTTAPVVQALPALTA